MQDITAARSVIAIVTAIRNDEFETAIEMIRDSENLPLLALTLAVYYSKKFEELLLAKGIPTELHDGILQSAALTLAQVHG